MGGNHIVMNLKNYTEPLTEAEEKTLHELSKNPDPCSRLQSNYYQLRQREIHARYADALTAEPANDYKERQSLQERLMHDLTALRKEYELDLDNAIQLHLAMIGVVSWKPAA